MGCFGQTPSGLSSVRKQRKGKGKNEHKRDTNTMTNYNDNLRTKYNIWHLLPPGRSKVTRPLSKLALEKICFTAWWH